MLTPKRMCYVVDDDTDDQEIFMMAIDTMKNPGVKIKMFSRAKEFLSELSTSEFVPDYIFMDLNMPEMDGFECLLKLQGLNIAKGFKLIVVSTSNNEHDISRAKSLGAEDYIVKPYSITEYSQILSQYIK